MDQQEYLRHADACLERVAKWLEDFDPDELDYSAADGVVTLEFAGGAKFILSRQAATKQLWLAAGAGAWHYTFDGSQWLDDKDGHELCGRLAAAVGEKLGREVEFG